MDTGTTLLHQSDDNRSQKKGRPRGRPFKKKSELAEATGQNLDARGLDGSDGGEIIEAESKEVEEEGEAVAPLSTEHLQAAAPSKELEEVESIEFTNGKNTLSLVFSRRHNRMFQMKIMLNGKKEMRPNTFTGASSGFGYWNLLKESLE